MLLYTNHVIIENIMASNFWNMYKEIFWPTQHMIEFNTKYRSSHVRFHQFVKPNLGYDPR